MAKSSKKIKRKRSRRVALANAMVLIDEGAQLLRTLPLSAFAVYYIGLLPFAAAAIYFVSFMLNNAYAHQYSMLAPLGMVFMFGWLKAWQSRFCAVVWHWIGGDSPPPLKPRQFFRLYCRQLAVQPFGLFLVPLSMGFTISFAVVYNFFNSALVFGGLRSADDRGYLIRAGRQASTAFIDNMLLAILLGLVACVVTLNVLALVFGIPFLAKTLLGIESALTRGLLTYTDITLWCIIITVFYAIFDPLVRAIYTLRCFYAESKETGSDLLAELRGLRLRGGFVVLLAIGLLVGVVGRAEEIPPEQLEQKIEETLRDPDYSWRLPREEEQKAREDMGIVERFYHDTNANLKRAWNSAMDTAQGIADSIAEFFEKLFESKPKKKARPSGGGWDFSFLSGGFMAWLAVVLKFVAFAVIVVVLVYAVAKLVRYLHKRFKDLPVAVDEKDPKLEVDLEDEEVTADQLPEDGWLLKANEMADKGDLRLAMRALYLSLLAYLGERRLIAIAKFKSNNDYVRELERRSHELMTVLDAFRDNVGMFEFAWYGMHEVEPSRLDAFKSNISTIKGDAER